MVHTERFAGRVCVVTGAARSIGLAIAQAMARNGAAVGMIDIDGPTVKAQAASLTDEGLRAAGYKLDITDRDAVLATFEQIAADLGTVDVLVNNAGVVDQRPFEQITPE
jgi:NAD(P)-dependent dehydrogenase (short-subunit alcohol dehydrogenase family)